MSNVLARFVLGAIGASLVAYSVAVWRSKRMPFMVGKADALYWGQRWRGKRIGDTVVIGIIGCVIVIRAIVG